MSYNSRLQENNAALQGILDTVNALPEAGTGDAEPVIEALAVTENGTYEAPEGVDGFSPVTVSVDNRYDEGYSEGYSEGYNASQESITLQEKTATANGEVTPDAGYTGLSKVTVAVPKAAQAVPVIDVDTNGLITATSNQIEGYVIEGSKSATQQLPTIGAMTITPTETEQVAVSAGTFVTGDVKVAAVEAGCTEPDPHELYQRVEYIESAEEGTYPYIITDFYADNSCGAEVIASFPTLQDRIPMGSRENSDATRFYVVYPLSANSIYFGFNTGVTVSCQLKVNTIYRLQTNFLNSRLVNVYDENGARKGGTSINAALTTQSAPVSIFGYNSASSGNVTSKREFKLYSARCSRGHEVVREYFPCYRKSDGIVGLYERFTKQFLTAEDGLAFAAGPEVDWDWAA